MDSTGQALVQQLQTKGGCSKKFRMTIIGLVCVMFIFLLSIIAMVLKPEIAPSISPFASVIVPSIAGFVAVYTGSQAYSDGKTTEALKSQ